MRPLPLLGAVLLTHVALAPAHQVADIYDILTRKPSLRKLSQGTQYVVGVYREPPLHLKRQETKTVSMTSGPGTKFTCHVPLTAEERQEREESGSAGDDGTVEPESGDEGGANSDKSPEPEEPKARVPKPPPDPYAFLMAGLPAGCLVYNNGYWNYELCMKNSITQFHGQVRKPKFNLGRLRPGKLDPVVHPDFAAMKPSSRFAGDFLLTQVIFDDGDDQRRALVNVRCSKTTGPDRILALAEPDMHVYVFDVHLRRACEYPMLGQSDPSEAESTLGPEGKPQGTGETSPKSLGTVQETLDNVFALIEAGPTQKPCLYYQPGWFTYELCYKQHIRQYHLDKVVSKDDPKKVETKIVQEYSLGKWDGEEIASLSGSTPDKSYAMQSFVGGTKCDMTGEPRSTKLHFKCNKDIEGTRVETYQELQTCQYLFTLSTSALCEHEAFKPETMSTEEVICYLTNTPEDVEAEQIGRVTSH